MTQSGNSTTGVDRGNVFGYVSGTRRVAGSSLQDTSADLYLPGQNDFEWFGQSVAAYTDAANQVRFTPTK